jgi:mRNA interferase HigB
MRIIKPKTVEEWAARYPDAGNALEKWMTLLENANWRSFGEMRAVVASVDEVLVESGRRVAIFNIGGNKYRLAAAIHYNTQIVYVMLFMTHGEYSKDRWKKVL